MTISQALQIAVLHHQAGRLAEAEALYRQIVAVQPNHADALHLLGLIAHQLGHHELAVERIRKAIVFDPNNPIAHANLGEACRAMGRFEEAVPAYRRALELKPDYPEAHNNLGSALAATGQLDEAVAAFRCALQLKPGYPQAHNNLGVVLRRQGQLDEAAAAYRRALELDPEFPEAHNNLGNALKDLRRFGEAIAEHRRALQIEPNLLEAHNDLGAALAASGQLDEAIAAYRRALELTPGCAEVLCNLGSALAEKGQFDEAMAACRRALELRPGLPEAHHNLGAALKELGRLDEAIAAYRRALELEPGYPEAHNNLGVAFKELRRLDEAVAEYRRALELRPGYTEAINNLGAALAGQGHVDEAIAAYRHALELKPDFPECLNNLGNALKDQGELEEAFAGYRRALQIKPDYAMAHSNLVYTLHFHPGHNASTISEEHQRWNRQFGDPLRQFILPHPNDRSRDRRLRVGYVSPDFLDHAVARYLLPLFERHDREEFEILCYSGTVRPDAMTARFRALAGGWRNTVGVSDASLAEMIREDKVDILVDLALHSGGNRLPVFARQPAPVQVAWLGYPGSTGLPGIGYRLTDAHMDPPGEKPAWSAEEPVRLPDSWCCYDSAGDSPEINELPALSAEGVTFGSLNNFAKVNEGVLALWAQVLEAVNGSRLLMLCPEGRTRERVRAFFDALGIATQRLELVGILPRWEYLRLYQRIDIALDPFPCNGMATTCDALWMGAPVLTLPGVMPVSRAGLSLLSSVGLGEFAASSKDDYVRMAAELAGDLPRLADLRATLRARMLASPLMDAPRFARNVETAYRRMWKAWSRKQPPEPE